jgi:biopolymer transport protein ExbD
MAEIVQEEGHKGKGKKKAKKHGTHIDMTPMVDLACLLLTFFMLTTAFNKPKVMEIVLPEKPKPNEPVPELDKSRALNILLVEHDKILWYNGLADPNKILPTLAETNFTKEGVRKLLLQRNKELYSRISKLNKDVIEGKIKISRDTLEARIKRMQKDDRFGPIVLIKAADSVKYRNLVDIMDEMVIANVARYSLVDINQVEKMMVKNYFRTTPSGTAH